MKKGNSERWSQLENVKIPPINRDGYEENVLRRDIWETSSALKPDKKAEAYLIRCATNEKISLLKDNFVIGKGTEADYKIEGNAAISRKHICVRKTGDDYLLEDLNSSNHTYVDEVMVNDTVKIHSGQLVKLADEAFAFFIEKVEK